MSETSVMNTMDYVLQSIGYHKIHEICRRTYGNETKAHTDNPHLPIHNANWGYPNQERQQMAMAAGPENPVWVRSARSSPRR